MRMPKSSTQSGTPIFGNGGRLDTWVRNNAPYFVVISSVLSTLVSVIYGGIILGWIVIEEDTGGRGPTEVDPEES